MANTDLVVPVAAKKIGPAFGNRSRPKIYYVQSQDIENVEPGLTNDDLVLKLKKSPKKVVAYESTNDFLAAQALAQGATASIQFASRYATVTASGSTVGSAIAIDKTKYINEVNAGNGLGVSLPDPFNRKVVRIYNTTTGSIVVYGRGTTTAIDGSTAGYTLPAGKSRTFCAELPATAGTTAPWQSAT